jgi:predicted small lipoprotein YifL
MRALLILLPALLLAACGQKGALYLPSQAPGKHHHSNDSSPAMTDSAAPAATSASGASAALSGSAAAPAASTATSNAPTAGASSGTP